MKSFLGKRTANLDQLSQNDMDALLKSMSPTDVAEGESDLLTERASLYDFRNPQIFGKIKEQIRAFDAIHKSFAGTLQTFLSSSLRVFVEVNITSADMLPFADFSNSMSDPTCIYIYNARHLGGDVMLEISPQFALYVVDRLFGGSGDVGVEAREITDIERNVLRRTADRTMEELSKAWENVIDFEFEFRTFETNPHFAQIAPPGETCLLVPFEIKTRNFSSFLNVCIPLYLVEDIMPTLGAQHMSVTERKKDSKRDSELVEENLMRTKVPVVASLGDVEMTLKNISQLQIGDVVRLDQGVNDEVQVSIDNQVKFRGHPGLVGKKKAVKITKVVSEDTEER